MKIYKYHLAITDLQTLNIPGLVTVLSITKQHGRLVLYAIIDDEDNNHTEISVRIIGTGHDYDLNTSWTFLGTHSTNEEAFMWHIWWNYSDNI